MCFRYAVVVAPVVVLKVSNVAANVYKSAEKQLFEGLFDASFVKQLRSKSKYIHVAMREQLRIDTESDI